MSFPEKICNNSFCEKWHPPECWFHKTKSVCRFATRMHIVRLMNIPAKGQTEWWQKCSGYVENYTTIGLRIPRYGPAEVFVDFTEELKHAETDQNPSLRLIYQGEPHQRSPNAPQIKDQSQEETEWQEQGAREAAWNLAKNVLNSKEQERTTFFSPSENWCLPAPFTLKPEEREFVVDSDRIKRKCGWTGRPVRDGHWA